MAFNPLTTYKDLKLHVIDFLGGNPGGDVSRDARRAVQNGYRDLGAASNWSYFYQRGRVNTVAPYSTGTIAYTQATRTVTLNGGTWPSWAQYGVLVIGAVATGTPVQQTGNVLYQVASNPTSTTLVLTSQTNPGVDIPAGTTFTLIQDTYPLPIDAMSCERMILLNNAYALTYEHVGLWMERQRIFHGPAMPRFYTYRGDQSYYGAMAVSFFPAPDNAYPIDFIYKRRPRPLVVEDYNTGTASCVSGQFTLTGVGTAWTADMVGSVVRLSADSLNLPDGVAGSYPFAQQRVVMSWTSATSITVDQPWSQTLTGVKHVISDPVDMEDGAMLTALFRSIEYQISMTRAQKRIADTQKLWNMALIFARECDSRNFAVESPGGSPAYPYRLAQMPRGPDVS
jgi:hypothetical protein